MRALVLAAAASALISCVPYTGELPPYEPMRAITQGPFQLLDPGAYQLDSLHFLTRAYGGDKAREVSERAEQSYNRIMVDTNLYSFKPKGLYEIVVYANKDEYRRKTGQPEWSGGVSVGNSIFSYEGPQLHVTLAHEMTHLIFYEYMGGVNLRHRWVNEGLAVYEERKAAGVVPAGPEIFSSARGAQRRSPMPMDQMLNLVPATEQEANVSLWYAQAESMVRHMIERGGRIGFSEFLAALKDNRDFDSAIGGAFPGVWRNLADFEQAWQRSVQ